MQIQTKMNLFLFTSLYWFIKFSKRRIYLTLIMYRYDFEQPHRKDPWYVGYRLCQQQIIFIHVIYIQRITYATNLYLLDVKMQRDLHVSIQGIAQDHINILMFLFIIYHWKI
jgi:hypothetical protein